MTNPAAVSPLDVLAMIPDTISMNSPESRKWRKDVEESIATIREQLTQYEKLLAADREYDEARAANNTQAVRYAKQHRAAALAR